MPPTAEFEGKKILIVLHGSIGDVTRALPLAAMLRRKFPRSFLAWSIEPACLPLLQGNQAVDGIFLFDRRRWWAGGGFLARVRAARFDLVLDLQRHFKSGFISWWSGAPQRVGFHRRDSKEFNWLFNNRYIPPCGDGIAKIDHYLKFADFFGIERSPLEWDFHLTAEEEASVERYLGKSGRGFAVLFAGTRWPSKQWFPAQIAQCAEHLQREYGLDVVLLGAASDQHQAGEARALTSANLINLAGRTSLREAIALIQQARVAVGPDTGLMHIAAAVRTPVVSLWGATRPQRTGPYGFADLAIQGKAPCVPCERRTCSIGRICMRSITMDLIGRKIRNALDAKTGEPMSHASAE
jgi:lipopolysaccharide heptosyltransferase II